MDLKMLSEYLLVREDLLSNYLFENGFDVTVSQTVAAIDAIFVVLEQQEAGNAAAATDAAMPLLQPGVCLTRSCPACAATCLSEATASSSCNDELLEQPALFLHIDRPRATILQEWKGNSSSPRIQKKTNFFERSKASPGSSGGDILRCGRRLSLSFGRVLCYMW